MNPADGGTLQERGVRQNTPMKNALVAAAAILSILSPHAFAQDDLRLQASQLFGRLQAPPPTALESRDVTLGRARFWDTRLSLDGKTACASCHLEHGADRRKASIDAKGLPTSRHSPTVFNSMGQPTLRWLGDRKTGA